MIEVSNSDFRQAVRLMRAMSRYPARDRRESEVIRMMSLLAKKWERKAEDNGRIHKDT